MNSPSPTTLHTWEVEKSPFYLITYLCSPPPPINYLTSPLHSPPSTYTPTSTYLCSLITPHLNVTLPPPPPNPDLRNVIHLLYLCSHPFPQLICGTLSLLHMCLFVHIVYLHVYTIVLFPFETHQLVNNWFWFGALPPPHPPFSHSLVKFRLLFHDVGHWPPSVGKTPEKKNPKTCQGSDLCNCNTENLYFISLLVYNFFNKSS